jgi:hypothetical protein
MSPETESILCRFLNDVDRIRKRQTIAFVVLVCIMVGLFLWLGHVTQNPAIDVRQVMLVAVFVLFLGMVYVGMAVAMVQSKMTLKVLKAIALLSKQ